MSISFVQYKYCPLCRTSCKKLRKHVHSPKHQEIVKNILVKFLKKISDAKSHLENPVAKDVNWSEAGRKIWCYFCSCDVDLHLHKTTMVGDCTLLMAGFLGHITRKDHTENTAKFLKDNLVDMKRTPEFLLDNEVFLKFLEKAEKSSVDFLNEKHQILQKAANAIRLQNEFRHHVVNQALLEQNLKQQSSNIDSRSAQETCQSNIKNDGQLDGERKKTIQAFGDGLTIIDRLDEDDSLGNIHTNAIPPWLRQDEEKQNDDDTVIGPTISDWMKHKKLEKKRKLPACRVGAKFDHKTVEGDEWMPNFGGVWSHGPRTKAGKHFKKRLNSAFLKPGELKESSLDSNNSTFFTSTPSPSHQTNTDDGLSRQNHPGGMNIFTHHHTENNIFTPNQVFQQDFHQGSSSNIADYPSVSNSHRHFGDFNSFRSNNSFDLSSFSSKSIKPYISKRRKMGHTSSISSTSTLSSKDSFSLYSTNFGQPSLQNSGGNEIDRHNLNKYSMTPGNSAAVRLLPTPVLTKKK